MKTRTQVSGILATAALALVAAGCGSSSAAKSASPTTTAGSTTTASAATSPPKSFAAYQTCLQQHGASFLAAGKRPTAAQLKKLQPALKACASKRPTGGPGAGGGGGFGGRNNPAFQKYAACLSQHGVKPGAGGGRPGTPPTGQSSSKLTAARAACASLRPAGVGRPPSG
jgi:hypothetical protein